MIAALTIFLTMCVPVIGGSVNVNGAREIEIRAGGEQPLDLFGNYTKALMPGETVTFRILVKNSSAVPVNMYLKAADTPADQFPTPEDKAKSDKLLKEIRMQIEQITDDASAPLFTGLADGTAEDGSGGLREYVHLGLLNANGETYLEMHVQVPVTLDNTYQAAIGKIDWIFRIEETAEESSTEPATTEPGTEPTTAKPGSETTTAKPGDESTTAKPGDEFTTAKPGTEPTTAKPGTETTTAKPGDESTTAKPGDEFTTAKPGDESTTAKPGTETTTAKPGDESTTAKPGDEFTTAKPGTEPTTKAGGTPSGNPATTASRTPQRNPDVVVVVPPNTGVGKRTWMLIAAGVSAGVIALVLFLPRKKKRNADDGRKSIRSYLRTRHRQGV